MTFPLPRYQGAGWSPPLRGMAVRTRTATDAGGDMLVNSPDGWEIEQPWLWWEGGNLGPGGGPNQPGNEGTVWGNPPPGADGWASGTALGSAVPPAVTRCTSLIADTIAGLPWQLRRENERLAPPPWIEDPQARRRDGRIYGGPVPQWRRSAVEFRASSIKSMLWAGESVWYVPVRNADGSPSPPIWQLNPRAIDIDGLEYVIPGGDPSPLLDGIEGAGAEYRFGDDELIVIRGELGEGLRGVGLLDQHFRDLELAGQLGAFALNLLRRGIPNGYLKVSAPNVPRPKLQQLQRDWMRAHGGPLKQIAVLNATTDFQPIGMTPQALELARMREYSIIDWALIFGINPYFLGVTQGRDTYANVESRMSEFITFSLMKWTRRMESGCDAELVRGTDMRVNFNALLRPDTLARYQAHRIALGPNAPFLTVPEVRAMEDKPDMTIEAELEAAAAQAEQARIRAAAAAAGGMP